MLRDFDREDLETLWKLVKAKHGSTRPEEGYERELWGNLMIMFEPDIESLVWSTLQNEKVLIWKLFDSCGVHFLRLQSMHIFMLVEKRYPLKPATIIEMLNKKLQTDHLNEMCYQLLKLMTKQLKNPGSGRIVGIKSFIRLFGITVALIKVSIAQEERKSQSHVDESNYDLRSSDGYASSSSRGRERGGFSSRQTMVKKRMSFNPRVEKRVWDLGLMKCLDQGYGMSLVRNVEDMRQEGNGLFGSQDLCLRQELLEYMGVHDNDASESSQPSWGKMCTSGT
ncbi:hypothetical protein Tco_0149111 [Tanacetum coccineum]